MMQRLSASISHVLMLLYAGQVIFSFSNSAAFWDSGAMFSSNVNEHPKRERCIMGTSFIIQVDYVERVSEGCEIYKCMYVFMRFIECPCLSARPPRARFTRGQCQRFYRIHFWGWREWRSSWKAAHIYAGLLDITWTLHSYASTWPTSKWKITANKERYKCASDETICSQSCLPLRLYVWIKAVWCVLEFCVRRLIECVPC